MAERIPQSATKRVAFRAYLSTDHLSAATSKTIAITLSKNGGAFANPSGGVTNATEIANGWYYVDLTVTDTGTTGPLIYYGTASGVDTVEGQLEVANAHNAGFDGLPNATAGAASGVSTLDSNLSVLANALLRGTASAGGGNTITLTGGVATDNLYKYALVQILSGTGAGQVRLIIDYVGSTKVATTQKSWATNPDNTSVYAVLPYAVPTVVHSGIAQAGAASTITLQNVASATDSTYNGSLITIFGGTGAFQSRIIQSYVGSTKVATLDSAWTTNPDSTSVYEISAVGRSWADVFQWNGAAVAAPTTAGVPAVELRYILGTILTETAGLLAAGFKKFFNVVSPTSTMNEITLVDTTTVATTATALTNAPTAGDFTAAMKTSLNAATPASVVGAVGSVAGNVAGSVASVVGNVGGNVVGSVASVVGNVGGSVANLLDISAAALARFFTRDSGSTYGASVAGSVVKEIATNAATSPLTIAQAVLNAVAASYNAPSTIGEKINSAGSASDPWATTLPAGYTGSQAGAMLPAVKAKTDLLGVVTVGFISPVADDGITTTLYVARDYNLADSLQLDYPTTQTVYNTDVFTWSVGPFGSPIVSLIGTYVNANKIRVQPTAADTLLLAPYINKQLPLEIKTVRSGRTIEQVRGVAIVSGVVSP